MAKEKSRNIPIEKIHDLPGLEDSKQPDKAYGSLVSSILINGIKEPVILRPMENGEYQLVAGYRRKRAVELAKLQEIPALIYDMTEKEALEYRAKAEKDPKTPIPGKLVEEAAEEKAKADSAAKAEDKSEEKAEEPAAFAFPTRCLPMKQKNRLKPWCYALPAMLLILIIIVFPIGYTGYISLTNMNLYHWNDYRVIGLDNYARALFKFDSGFLEALLTTIIWTVLNMVIQLAAGFFIALGLNAKGLKLKRIYKTLLMVPWAMPAYISILLWRVGMFNTEFGILNKFLKLIGLGKVDFLASNGIAFMSCVVLNLWMALPFMISTIDGALQSVDGNLYESATLDGAGFWTKVCRITVPSIRPIVAPAAVMTTFITFKQFDIIYLLTQQKGYMTGATLNTVIRLNDKNAIPHMCI